MCRDISSQDVLKNFKSECLRRSSTFLLPPPTFGASKVLQIGKEACFTAEASHHAKMGASKANQASISEPTKP